MTATALERFLAERRRLVDRALRDALRGGEGRPARLGAAMRYAVLGPGKRVRPILALASAETVGGRAGARRVLPFACALELIHAYSLVHDDLPAMDDDDVRRGKPSLHVRFGEALAILTGDALLTEAFALMAAGATKDGFAGRSLAIVAEVARAAGADGMVAGQVVDLASEGRSRLSLRTVAAIHRRKTGALIRCAVRAGAIAGGATPRQLERLTTYGEALGLAFQIADDILDATHASALIGRHGGGDAARGKATYPALLGVEGARERARAAEAEACRAVRPFAGRAEPLEALVRHVVGRAA